MTTVDVEMLKKLMSERNVTNDALALAMGVNRSTLYRKINEGGKSFTAEDIYKMRDFIPLTDQEAIDIFLTHKVALSRQEPTLTEK